LGIGVPRAVADLPKEPAEVAPKVVNEK
jgi:hypothetical protein